MQKWNEMKMKKMKKFQNGTRTQVLFAVMR